MTEPTRPADHPDPERPPPDPTNHHGRVLRKRMFVATLLLSLAIFVGFALAAYGFAIAHRNAQDLNRRARHDRLVLCQAQDKSNLALRRVLLLAEHLSEQRGTLTPEDRRFYRAALRLAAPINCRRLLASGG